MEHRAASIPTVQLQSRWSSAGCFVGLTTVYWLLGLTGVSWAVVPGVGSPVWPAAGVATSGLILFGPRFWPAIFLGRFLVAVTINSPQPLWADLLIAGSNTLAAVAPVLLLKRAGIIDCNLASLREMMRFLAIAAAFSALIAATLGSGVLWLHGSLAVESAPSAWLGWASGNFVGVVTVGVLVISWSAGGALRVTAPQCFHLAAALAATAVVSWLVFEQEQQIALRTWHLYPVLIWAALAFQVRGASAALLLMSSLAVYGTTLGLGPFADINDDPASRVAMLQQFLAVSATTTLLLAAVADERRGKEALARSEQSLREANAAKEILLQEVNHRVKNSLQVVVGLLTLQLRKAVDPDTKALLNDARARIEVVASLHQRLYKTSAHDHVEFASFSRELAEASLKSADLEGRMALEFVSDGDAVLPIGDAVPLSLILSELITNAAKYGIRRDGSGLLSIELRHDEGALRLRVADTGPGFPNEFDPKQSPGLGMKIVSSLARQLRATVTIENQEVGAAIVLQLPSPMPAHF